MSEEPQTREELLGVLNGFGAMARDWDRAVAVFDPIADADSAVLAVLVAAQMDAHQRVIATAVKLSETPDD
jgi:hypothetical protein